jgi:hypothetical protein
MEEVRNAYDIFVGKSENKKPLGRLVRKWENIIRLYLREIGWEVVDWVHLAQDRNQWRALVNMAMDLLVT